MNELLMEGKDMSSNGKQGLLNYRSMEIEKVPSINQECNPHI